MARARKLVRQGASLVRVTPSFVTVGRLAEALDLSRATAYRIARELDAVHVTPKALRIPVSRIRERFGAETAIAVSGARGRAIISDGRR